MKKPGRPKVFNCLNIYIVIKTKTLTPFLNFFDNSLRRRHVFHPVIIKRLPGGSPKDLIFAKFFPLQDPERSGR
jgi:hypothetical protein